MNFGLIDNPTTAFFINFSEEIRAHVIFSDNGESAGIMVYINEKFQHAYMGLNPGQFAKRVYLISQGQFD